MRIPSIPISAEDALPLLQQLGGDVAPEAWRGALPVTYHYGPGPARVRVAADIDWASRPVYNVIAVMRGTGPQQVVYGNHHDAWVNGAADPASGAAALLETARSLAEIHKQGWRPERTIVFALWDAEEFGLIGSTEWVEKHLSSLRRNTVAYLNTDTNTRGRLNLAGSPILARFALEIARDITDPGTGKTLLPREQEAAAISAPGAGSDYVAFVHHAGIPILNIGFSGPGSGGTYHSIYDSFEWHSRFGDPGFVYGRLLAQFMSTALFRLSGAPVLPLDLEAVPRAVRSYVEEIRKAAGDDAGKLAFDPLLTAANAATDSAKVYETQRLMLFDTKPAAERLAALNEVLAGAERSLTLDSGLPGRDWYKHQLYAPGLYTGYGVKTLPAVREAAEAGRFEEANQQIGRAAQTLREFEKRVQLATDAARAAR
jgi:N-acetylated-alpha-linked acidic dipeptidase